MRINDKSWLCNCENCRYQRKLERKETGNIKKVLIGGKNETI